MKLLVLVFSFLLFSNVTVFSFWSERKAKNAYFEKDYQKAKTVLEKEQIDDPKNPELNYNLGNIYYKLQKFDDAKLSFGRTIDKCLDTQKDLKEKASFNLGNSFYKNCLSLLGSDWEKKDLDSALLDKATKEIKFAVEKYKDVLNLTEGNKKADFNKKKAEELLKKLEEKKKNEEPLEKPQDRQKQQDDKKQNQDSNQNDDKKDQQNDNKSSNNKNNGSDNKQDSSQKNNENGNSNEQKSEGKDKTDDTESGEDKRKNDMFDHNERRDKNGGIDKENKHDQNPKNNNDNLDTSKENSMHQGVENQELNKEEEQQAAIKEEGNLHKDLKERGMKVLLDNLQSDESKLQKMLIMQKSKNAKPVVNDKQKPW